MIGRLLLMTDATSGWAERFLADVRASGVAVARLAESGESVPRCGAEVAAWYVGLEQVQVPSSHDCIVWLAARRCEGYEVPVVTVGGVASRWAGLREVAEGQGVSVVRLELHMGGGVVALDGRVLSTRRRWAANRAQMRDHAALMLRDWLARGLREAAWCTPVHGADVAPAPLGGVWHALRYALGVYPWLVAARLVRKGAELVGIRHGVWTLCLVDGGRLVPLPKPKGLTRADPFVARLEGQDWLFFEEYAVGKTGARGRLACAPLLADGRFGDVRPLLERGYHVSYPQVWEEAGRVWLMPETSAANKLEIFEVRLVEGWPKVERGMVVMAGASVADATVWRDPATGERWLFASLSRTRAVDHAVELHLFKVGGENGWELTPHPHNPVVKDCRTARCAGKMYVDEAGRLIRPCQAHVAGVYGAEVQLMCVTRLDMREYREEPVGSFAPPAGSGFDGVHHVCRLPNGRVMVDARRTWEWGWGQGA